MKTISLSAVQIYDLSYMYIHLHYPFCEQVRSVAVFSITLNSTIVSNSRQKQSLLNRTNSTCKDLKI